MSEFSPEEFSSVVDLFKALASKKRLEILRLLFTGPKCVHEICELVEISQPLASQHLRVLKQAKIIAVEARGRENLYSVADEHVRHLVIDAIEHVNE